MATTVTMPQLGETVTEGTILGWAKQAGDTIAEDEVLLEISTDKVDTEVPSPVAGTVLEILVPEGETVSVGTALALIGEAGEVVESTAPPVPEATAAPAAAPEPAPEPAIEAVAASVSAPPPTAPPAAAPPLTAPAPEPASTPTIAVESSPDAPKRAVLSPVVRKLAAENNVDLSQVTGTGDGGRITRKDVSRFIEAQRAGETPPPPPVPAAEVTFEPAPAPAPAPAPTPAPPAPASPTPA